MGLIDEGFNDVEYAFKCMIGDEQFSWEKFGNSKINFLINLAVKSTVSFIMNRFIFKLNNTGKNPVKDLIKEVGKKFGKKVAKEGVLHLGKQLMKNCFNDWIKKITDKDVSKK